MKARSPGVTNNMAAPISGETNEIAPHSEQVTRRRGHVAAAVAETENYDQSFNSNKTKQANSRESDAQNEAIKILSSKRGSVPLPPDPKQLPEYL